MNTLEEVIKTYGADWEADADAVHDLLHPAHEVKSQYECENCQEGFTSTITQVKDLCFCCNGNWQDCQNCHPEGTGNDTEDLLAGMRG